MKKAFIIFTLMLLSNIVYANELRQQLDIPAQALSSALDSLARQTKLQMLYDRQVVVDKRSAALHGEYTGIEAAQQLLVGTGLIVEQTGDDAVSIRPLADARESPSTDDRTAQKKDRVVDELPTMNVTGNSSTVQAIAEIRRTPGGVQIVSDTEFKNSPANTIRDIVGWVPGVITQLKSNVDNRISIRGSGLTRNYGNRGVNLYMDSIPINTSDGLTDVFEIDPTAYRYVEVYKGANALRYGANTLGGAVNFVTPTGRNANLFDSRVDGGSFGYVRGQASSGGFNGPLDWFINASGQHEDGFRDHSEGHIGRLNSNVGYQFSKDVETRFYLNANTWRQELPGELTKRVALDSRRSADPFFISQDQQRNIDSVRLANKTTLRFGATTVDLGLFGHYRHVDHPIFRYLDYYVYDYGGFARLTDDRTIAGYRNRFIAGMNVLNGRLDYKEYANVVDATKGALLFSTNDDSENYSFYFEDSFFVLPNVALIAGGQFLYATRDREDRFLSNGDQSGRRSYSLFNPKGGILWDVDSDWQVFANVSRSAEIPTFDANTFASSQGSSVDAQRATTYEIGTRGQRENFNWDIALYRSEIKDEFQCLRTSPFSACTVVNADRTVHQGIEAGLGAALLNSIFAPDDRFWLNLAYTLSDFHFDDDATYGDNQLPGVPRHYLRAELLYKHQNGFYIGPSVDWMPEEFYSDNANSLTVDPYALLNFRLGYESQDSHWSAYFEARNLLDKHYISSTIIAETADATSALFNPGYGTALFGGVRFQW